MADLGRAIAHADELLAEYDSTAGIPSKYAAGLRRLRAALDAARGEAAWQITVVDNTGTHDYAKWAGLQAPPAALASAEPTLEMVRAASSVLSGWIDSDLSDGIALKVGRAMLAAAQAQQPAAAVPEGYALVPVGLVNDARDALEGGHQSVQYDALQSIVEAAMLAAAEREGVGNE